MFVDKGFLDLSFCRQKLHRQKFDKKALFSDNAESEYGLFFNCRRFLWRLYNEYFSAECSEAHWTQRHAAQNIALLGRAHRK